MKVDIDKRLMDILINNSLKKIVYEDIKDESDVINDFGYDSISIINLVVEVENAFEIEINEEDLVLDIISKYGSLKSYIISKLEFVK